MLAVLNFNLPYLMFPPSTLPHPHPSAHYPTLICLLFTHLAPSVLIKSKFCKEGFGGIHHSLPGSERKVMIKLKTFYCRWYLKLFG